MTTFDVLTNRYRLDCTLVAEEALHIGAGDASANSDSPFVRENNRPYLPGSSLRGALRSRVESIVRAIRGPEGCCVLFEENPPGICDAGNKSAREKWEVGSPNDIREMMEAGGPSLCPVCELFGSTIKAGKLKISDAALLNDSEPVRRDGVGIDRDTGRAVDRIKYDFEALGRGCHFQCRIQLENAEDDDLALLFILLKEWEIGIDAGGRKARGLGRLKLKSYQVEWFVDLASYLSDNTANSEPDRFVAELREAFNRFINLQGGAGAKKTDQ